MFVETCKHFALSAWEQDHRYLILDVLLLSDAGSTICQPRFATKHPLAPYFDNKVQVSVTRIVTSLLDVNVNVALICSSPEFVDRTSDIAPYSSARLDVYLGRHSRNT